MAKILKRPMFKRGGSTNDGIMTGLTNRKQLSTGTLDPERARREAKEIQDIMESLAIFLACCPSLVVDSYLLSCT